MRHFVTVHYPQAGLIGADERPGPIPPDALDALISMGVCQGGTGPGSRTISVAASSVDEGVELADQWAHAYGIDRPGEVVRSVVDEAAPVSA